MITIIFIILAVIVAVVLFSEINERKHKIKKLSADLESYKEKNYQQEVRLIHSDIETTTLKYRLKSSITSRVSLDYMYRELQEKYKILLDPTSENLHNNLTKRPLETDETLLEWIGEK